MPSSPWMIHDMDFIGTTKPPSDTGNLYLLLMVSYYFFFLILLSMIFIC